MAVSSHTRRQGRISSLGHRIRRWSWSPIRKVRKDRQTLCTRRLTVAIGFPWCGYVIDMSDLSVRPDYSRHPSTCESFTRGGRPAFLRCVRYQGFYDGTPRKIARYSFHQQDATVRRVCIHAGPPYIYNPRFPRLARYQVQAINCDLELNTLHCVYFNLYTGFLLCGMKMHEHLRTSDLVVSQSTRLILGGFARSPWVPRS
jgi:hypothetical protein